jgi:hypothetical protein
VFRKPKCASVDSLGKTRFLLAAKFLTPGQIPTAAAEGRRNDELSGAPSHGKARNNAGLSARKPGGAVKRVRKCEDVNRAKLPPPG